MMLWFDFDKSKFVLFHLTGNAKAKVHQGIYWYSGNSCRRRTALSTFDPDQ